MEPITRRTASSWHRVVSVAYIGKGYKQVINVLQNHAANPEFCKKSCVILKQLLYECSDPQLPDKMIESGCAEALQLIIETPPEKDDETKQLVLEILNSLFTES